MANPSSHHPHETNWLFPDESNWRFDAIEDDDRSRTAALENAGPASALSQAIESALNNALDSRDVRFGYEHARDQWEDCRAVVQFAIGEKLFDWFFNGRTGYRAHFRAHHSCGIAFNGSLIEMARSRLVERTPDVILGRELNGEFEDLGEIEIPKRFLSASLVTNLSKVWFCTKRIGLSGGIQHVIPGLGGTPRIQLNEGCSWAAPYADSDSAWLDIKGAFLGRSGAYPSNDLIERARKLEANGRI
jgi:hypothetical protein